VKVPKVVTGRPRNRLDLPKDNSHLLVREAKILKILEGHSGIPEVHLVEVAASDKIIVYDGNIAFMRKLYRTLLQKTERDSTPLTPKEKLKICIGILEILVYCDGKDVRKGDIKPSNIMLDEDNHPFLIDWDGSIYLPDFTSKKVKETEGIELFGPRDSSFYIEDDFQRAAELRKVIIYAAEHSNKAAFSKVSPSKASKGSSRFGQLRTVKSSNKNDISEVIKSTMETRYKLPKGSTSRAGKLKRFNSIALFEEPVAKYKASFDAVLERLKIEKILFQDDPKKVRDILLSAYINLLKQVDYLSIGITLAKLLYDGDLVKEGYVEGVDYKRGVDCKEDMDPVYLPSPFQTFPFKPFTENKTQVVTGGRVGLDLDPTIEIENYLDRKRFEKIKEKSVRDAVKQLLILDPEKRLSFRQSLELFKGIYIELYGAL